MYSELIKKFDRIRAYMRRFYVYGFSSRNDFAAESARKYDDERRRVSSWLGEYMQFRQDKNGRQYFLSMDSRSIPQNPLYQAFRSKSFTDNDLFLYFCLMDMLRDREAITSGEAAEILYEIYLSYSETEDYPDDSTIRRKLKEYVSAGLIETGKRGKETIYFLPDNQIDLQEWQEALAFYSEMAPIGVIGSYMQEKAPDFYSFKHRYLFEAMDQEILLELLRAIRKRCAVSLKIFSKAKGGEISPVVLPCRIYNSVQNGRQYLYAWSLQDKRITFTRLDNIRTVELDEKVHWNEEAAVRCEETSKHIWGVSLGKGGTEHIEMLVHAAPEEYYIVDRMKREKRCGTVEQADEVTWKFSADVSDSRELIPWIRTFTGRIVGLTADNEEVRRLILGDFAKMAALYGGDADALQ